MRLSLMPSLRYSASGSPPVFSKGRTATDSMACPPREPKRPSPARRATINITRATAPSAHLLETFRLETNAAEGLGSPAGITVIGPTNR